jgi:Alginate lyase
MRPRDTDSNTKLNRHQINEASTTLTRRAFCSASAFAITGFALGEKPRETTYAFVARIDRARILKAAADYLPLSIKTITNFPAPPDSPGGPHDFYSQADYFWPNPAKPNGPYMNRDGQSNPNNFSDHRKAMIALSIQMPALTAAWRLTHNKKYGQHAADHLRAWFITPETRMNPNLQFAQGVKGASTGRSYGIIDTLHLVEVARAASFISPAFLTTAEQSALKQWFTEYLQWLKTSKFGTTERDAHNNHAVCWALQAAEYARLIDDQTTRAEIEEQYGRAFLGDQLAPNGSFPQELARTKPYSYSIFNFDVMAALCQSLTDNPPPSSNPYVANQIYPDLFTLTLPDGRGICKAAEFIYPYLKDKSTWPYAHDVEHFDSLPVRSPGLLFCGVACHHPDYLALWQQLNPDPTDPEIIRNYPIRQPLLWYAE